MMASRRKSDVASLSLSPLRPYLPFGRRVSGVTIADVLSSASLQAKVRQLLDEHGLLLFAEQHDLSPAQEVAFAKLFPWDDSVPLADCAVKVIKENDFVRIRDEVAALADLDGHPNVVGLLDVMEDGDGYAIAMPFFAHDDFGRALRKGASASAIRRAIFGAIL